MWVPDYNRQKLRLLAHKLNDKTWAAFSRPSWTYGWHKLLWIFCSPLSVRSAFRNFHGSFLSDRKLYIVVQKWRQQLAEIYLSDTEDKIADVKIFYGKIFVLTSYVRFGEFNPKAGSVPKFSKISIPFPVSSDTFLKLVASDNKLYITVINCYPYPALDRHLSLFEIDHETMDRATQIHDLGAKSLFLSWFSSAVVDTTGWGAGNCVCVLHLGSFNACSFFKLNGNLLGTIPVVWDSHSSPYFWYFPSETWSISCVSDEFGAWSLLNLISVFLIKSVVCIFIFHNATLY